ncbi:MAG: hypothetical protein KAJ53_11705 [Anaerolineales bacterium]|nr:hypothetical protein [Anaerolineales bacterium]
MKYQTEILAANASPKELEDLYQAALKASEAEEFKTALEACFHNSPDNILFSAWHFRLQKPDQLSKVADKSSRNWKLAIPLSLVTGLIFWALSGEELVFLDQIPYLLLFWAPIASLFTLVFLTCTAKNNYRPAFFAGIALLTACAYILLISPSLSPENQRHYLQLMAIHLPLLSWIGIGISILWFGSDYKNRFAFLIKSIEVMITAGVYLIAGIAFGAITVGMFQALNITLPDVLMRLIAAGGAGLIPVIAVVSVYDPTQEPISQDFTQGLSKFIATMMRLLLPLTLGVLVIYACLIPFNFLAPFENRDVLIVYNLMLFAIMGLLIGVTPIQVNDISPRLQGALRTGILAVAFLTVLVSLYALSATIYRSSLGGITINRLTIIGWNMINISILILIIHRLLKHPRELWTDSLQSVFSIGTNGYLVWTLFVILAIPILF